MPAPGLDPSWAFALNQAVAQGLAFGKDLVFTLGPYSAIYTKAYHPATDFMMIAGSCYLALSYWLAMLLLLDRRVLIWGSFVVFSVMIYARDSLLFSYPLLVGLLSYQLIAAQHRNKLIGLLFAPLGLLALVKGSLLILSLTTVLLCFAFFLCQRKPLLASLCLASFLLSMQFFWLAAGQDLMNLPAYLWQSLSLAGSFSEAMALDGKSGEIFVYLLCAILLLAGLVWQRQNPPAVRLFFVSLFFIFLFISFKAGFARHFGHSFIPATSILLAALALVFVSESKMTVTIMLGALCSWSFILGQHTRISLGTNLLSTYAPAWYGLKQRLGDKHWLEQNFTATKAFLHQQTAFPPLPGTTDIYSYEQTLLLASANTWSPRPIFQSYSVFNAQLAKRNRDHLSGANQPDNLIFRLEPIDNRIPSLEDGASWPLLIANYQPSQAIQDFLLLRKRDKKLKRMSDLATEKHYLGEAVALPTEHSRIFAEIDLRPTLEGRLAAILLKPSPLEISFRLQDGSERHYRLIASMAKSGFLISPLVETTPEFALLYGQAVELDSKRVKSFSINTRQTWLPQWQSSYLIHFKGI